MSVQRAAMLRALVLYALVIAYAACAQRSLCIAPQTPRAWSSVRGTRAASGGLWAFDGGNRSNCSQAPRLPRRFKAPPLKRTDAHTHSVDGMSTQSRDNVSE